MNGITPEYLKLSEFACLPLAEVMEAFRTVHPGGDENAAEAVYKMLRAGRAPMTLTEEAERELLDNLARSLIVLEIVPKSDGAISLKASDLNDGYSIDTSFIPAEDWPDCLIPTGEIARYGTARIIALCLPEIQNAILVGKELAENLNDLPDMDDDGLIGLIPPEIIDDEPDFAKSHPWRRYFARLLDSLMWLALLSPMLKWLLSGASERQAGVFAAILGLFLYHMSLVLLIFVEGGLVSRFGTTPGKYILAIRLVSGPSRGTPSYVGACRRAWLSLWQGSALGIPVWAQICNVRAFAALDGKREAPWDEKTGIRPIFRSFGAKNIVLAAIMATALLSMIILVFA